MSFFLIGKAPDHTLRLMCDHAFATRSEALSELSMMSARDDFAHFDDEILAMDLESGIPVLLVRPAHTAPSVEVRHVEVLADEPEAEVEAPVVPPVATEHDVPAEPEVVSVPDESPASLKEALERTAVALEEAGIYAPPSIGPESASQMPEETEIVVTEEDDSEPVAPEEPVAPAEVAEESDSESEIPGPGESWPWDRTSPEQVFDLDAIEEPGSDDDSLVRAPGDDETMSVARPVIMGAYAETAVEPVPEAAATSDFVDLGPAVPAPSLEEMTCDDCVYAPSCPNKDERTPSSCGSFQWK